MTVSPLGPNRTTRAVLIAAVATFVVALMVVPAGGILAGLSSSGAPSDRAASIAGLKGGVSPPLVNPATYNWPELHGNPQLTGFTTNTTISSANASQLGVHWAAELYGQAIDSPTIAYNAALGETLVYLGTETGYLMALNLATGQVVWANWLGSPLVSSPTYSDGSLYVATQRNTALFDVNATTGNVVCSVPTANTIEATAVVATPPGGIRTVYIAAEDSAIDGPMYAINAGNCSIEWQFTDYDQVTGSWNPASYGVTANGTPLVIFGSADPDSRVYAVNALTGALVWWYQTYYPAGGNFDIGAGITVSAPGVNGIASGAVYAINKFGSLSALNLANGSVLWSENINNLTGGSGPSRSAPALEGDNLVFGHSGGLLDVDPVNGAILWQYHNPSHTEIISSAAILGPTVASSVVVAGDLAGLISVVSLSNGSLLYSYQTGSYITGSPAISNGNIVIDSTDSLLYDFQVGGGNGAHSTTSTSSPGYSSSLPNPNGPLTIYGNATDTVGVGAVGIGIESGGVGGPWYDASTASWVPGPYTNPTTLTSPGATSSAWKFSFTPPKAGGAYTVEANAISTSGQTDAIGASIEFAVEPSTSGAHLAANPSTVGPGQTTVVNGGAFTKGETVTIRYLNTTLATEKASSTGYLPDITVRIPTTAGFGLAALSATGKTSQKSATVAIEVLNDWDQDGYNATHTGSEPYDPTFYNLIAVGTGNYMHLAWNFVAGAPVNASPVVANDVVYLADTAGILYSVSVHNGGMYWVWNGSGGSSLLHEAVDPSQGLLFVTAANGELYAISTATGLTVWSASVGGTPTAPVFAYNGVFVGSSTGAVDRFQENTGILKWSVLLASKVTATPAINLTGKLLVIGEWNGDVLGLSTATGATYWTYVTGGAVKAAAVTWGGSVYVGSDDERLYALSSTNGSLLWKFKTGGAIEDTGVITYTTNSSIPGFGTPLIVIGANNGEIYGMRASNGKVWFTQTGTSAVVGLAVVQGMIVSERAGGLIDGFRNYANFGLFTFQTTAWLASSPAIVNGAVYVTTGAGDLNVYTGNGQPPV
jgi:eukaryotic-like serine/threonine-protein kinase